MLVIELWNQLLILKTRSLIHEFIGKTMIMLFLDQWTTQYQKLSIISTVSPNILHRLLNIKNCFEYCIIIRNTMLNLILMFVCLK